LTARALLAGAAIGCVLAVANVYMGLKSGWADSGNITAATLGFVLFNVLARRVPYSRLENNITQTAASAAAFMAPAMGLLTAFPALALLGRPFAPWWVLALGLLLALAGVLVALPLREPLLLRERLAFPTGIATVAVIEAMHGAARTALRRGRALLAAAGVAGAITWLRDGWPAPLDAFVALPLRLAGAPGRAFTLGVAVSPMMLAVGIFIGVRNSLSMLLGAVVAWAVIAPRLVAAGIAVADYASLVPWLVWPAVALLVSSAFTSLLLDWRSVGRALGDARGLWRRGRLRLVLACVAALVALIVLLSRRGFALHPLIGMAAALVGLAFAVVCARSAGETDIVPSSAGGQLTQVVCAFGARHEVAANLYAGHIVTGSGTQTAAFLWSLKAGQLLGASPRRQLAAQVIGCAVGAFASLGAYWLLTRAQTLGSTSLPAPGALAWKTVADLAAGGTATLPRGAAMAAAIATLAGIILSLGSRRWTSAWVSPVAMGIGMLTPASYALTAALGGLMLLALQRRRASFAEQYAPSIAAGGIAGESLAGVIIAMVRAFTLAQP
jgi:uncharacterized oligopeptide transporter (OPT) family protein